MRWKRINLPEATAGPLKPCPTFRCQTTGGPSLGQEAANAGPVQTPLRVGPRNWGQSLAEARVKAAATTKDKRKRQGFDFIADRTIKRLQPVSLRPPTNTI